MDFQEGEILYFDKPLHWTSFKLVKTLRNSISRALGIKKIKVGHAGTLDPLASGVMIICTGKSTKLIESFQYQTKEYIATLRLGATTPSHDLETEIDATYPVEHITRELVEQTLPRFVGTISQVPPAFSACKVDGRRAYKMARKGQSVELKPKELVIDEIELLDFTSDILRIRVVCSKGTYTSRGGYARSLSFGRRYWPYCCRSRFFGKYPGRIEKLKNKIRNEVIAV